MRARAFFLLIQLLMTTLLLTACGGGGGGGKPVDDGGNSEDNDEASGPSDEELAGLLFEDTGVRLEYSGNEESAELKSGNVAALVSPALASGLAGFVPGMLGTEEGTLTALIPRGAIAVGGDARRRGASEGETASEYITVDRVSPCENGEVAYSGYILSTGLGKITGDFRDCRDGAVEIKGVITLSIQGFNRGSSTVTKTTRSFNRLNISVDGVDYTLTGRIGMKLDVFGNQLIGWYYDRTANVIVKNNSTGAMTKVENLVEQYRPGDAVDDVRHMSLKADVYHSEHGHARIDARRLYAGKGSERPVPPVSGYLDVQGANENAYVRVTFLNANSARVAFHTNEPEPFTYHQAFLSVDRFGLPENSDLSDSDGDQMHDSWEAHYGLDPHDRNDAREDLDGDGMINLEEYLRGTQPNAETQLETRFSPAQFELADTTSDHFPAGRQVQFDFDVLTPDGSRDSTLVYFNFPATFEIESGDGPVDYCDDFMDDAIVCGFAPGSSTTVGYPRINILANLPEEPGLYDIGVLLLSRQYGATVDVQVLTQTVEVQPAYVDLRVESSDAENPGVVGAAYEYDISVTNTGTIAAENVRVVYSFPDTLTPVDETGYTCSDGNCLIEFTYGSVAAGATVTPGLQIVLDPSAGPTVVETNVSVTTDSQEAGPEDNSYTASTDFRLPVADLKLEASTYQGYAPYEDDLYLGKHAVWTVRLGTFPARNDPGGDYSSRLIFTLNLPPEIRLYDIPHGCEGATGTVTCVRGALEDRWAQFIELEMISNDTGVHEMTAELSHLGTDPDPSDNTVTLTTLVGSPMDDIQAQIDSAPGSDTVTTITVAPGYYYGELYYPTKRINLVSSGSAEQTFLSPNGDGIQPGPTGEITGFTFIYGTAGIHLTDSNVQVHGNVFDHMNHNTDYLAGGVYWGFLPPNVLDMILVEGASNAVVEKNVMRNTNCGGGWSSVIRIRDTAAPTISNNLVVANSECHGIYIHGDADSGAIVVNNTLVGNEEAVVIPGAARVAGAYASNNIIAANRIGFRGVTDCGTPCAAFQNNLVYDNAVADYANTQDLAGWEGNLSAAPLFADPPNGDYSLQAGSPAVDAGDPANAPPDDLNGASRTGTPDMGAFERP